MPRPTGGFGGSGSSGGGFGGGSRGGGFGGGYHHHHHYHRPYGGFFFFPWRRPYYGYGGGCLGGLLSLFLLPIILLLFAGIFIFVSISELVVAIANGGVVQYNEQAYRQYSLAHYEAEFSADAANYEHNILVTFTTCEGYDYYYSISQIGNYLEDEVHTAFSQNGAFHRALNNSLLSEDYNDSLDRDLYSAITAVTASLKSNGDLFLAKPTDTYTPKSTVKNYDENIAFTGEMTTLALQKFTEETGISIVLIIDDEEAVFGKTFPTGTLVLGLVSLGIMVFAIVWIVKSVKAKNENAGRTDNTGGDYNDPRYWN